MSEIQRDHITNNNHLCTDTKGYGTGGNTTIINQDNFYLIESAVADVPCEHSELTDGL